MDHLVLDSKYLKFVTISSRKGLGEIDKKIMRPGIKSSIER